jgi:hypothetical protein
MKFSILGVIACCAGALVACSSDDADPTTSPPESLEPAPQPEPEPEPAPTPPGVLAANIADVENRGADCALPTLPAYADLTENALLPDPFVGADGTRITTKEAWTCRRAELAAQVQEYELGPKPPRPTNVSGALADNVFTITVDNGGPAVSFNATITLPTTGTAPYPAVIVLGGGTSFDANGTISGRGVALISLDHGDVAAQMNGSSRGIGKFYDLYGADHPAGAMIAWAWGASRLIDALESTPEANIDPDRLGVTGCSRNGKGALVVGAFDDRIALTLPQESGAGGSSLWRMADANQQAWIAAGQVPDYGAVQTLAQIVMENVWFRASFADFSQTATRLPFDHHSVMGLVAPRAMLVVNNTDQYWLDREGSNLGAMMGHSVWQALGLADSMGQSQVGGHNHCVDVPQAQLDEVGAYVDKFLIGGGTGNTSVMYSDGLFPDRRAEWADWQPPVLETTIQ